MLSYNLFKHLQLAYQALVTSFITNWISNIEANIKNNMEYLYSLKTVTSQYL